MATVLSTLYPPLVDTFMPAFPSNNNAVVTFSISPYNSSYEIRYLHVTLVNQKTNKNAFNNESSAAPSGTKLINGVWIIPFSEMLDNNTNRFLTMDREANSYTLFIPPTLLKETNNTQDETRKFVTNCYYKVQLRFDKYQDTSTNTSTISEWNSDYLSQKRAYFSEWSSVCLLKAIPTITLHLNNFTLESSQYQTLAGASVTNETSLSSVPVRVPQYVPGIIPFAGNLTFEGYNDAGIDNKTKTEYFQRDIRSSSGDEYIYSYRIVVKRADADEKEDPIGDSGIQYPARNEKTNNFYWLCDLTGATSNQKYNVELTFTTNNQYTFSKTFEFSLINQGIQGFNPTFSFNKRELIHNGLGNAWKPSSDPAFANKDASYLTSLNSKLINGETWYEDENEKVLVTCEDGWVQLTVKNAGDAENQVGNGYLFIKRATSLDSFTKWELIDCSYIEKGSNFSHTITDKTVGSLVRYKYACQFMNAKGNWSTTFTSMEVVYPDFHDVLLSRGDKQLAIRYNGQITSMTPVVNRIKIDTLGGRYPRFAENAKMHYKQFQLSGIITAESDYNRTFLNDLDYKDEMAIYDEQMNGKYLVRNDTIQETGIITTLDDEGNVKTYSNGTYSIDISERDTETKKRKATTQQNTRHDIYPMDNWWWERLFREEVIEWLNDGEPKLYRSMTEGNMIVMIDSISLTPNQQLGRRIWNFSCTVYEVGDGNSLDELDSLGIFTVPNEYGAVFDDDYAVNIDTDTTENFIGQTTSVTANLGNSTTLIHPPTSPGVGDRGNIIITNDDGVAISDIKTLTIGENIANLYQGFYSNYKFDESTIRLTDVKIQFESLPQWYDLDSMSPKSSDGKRSALPGGLYFTVETDNETVEAYGYYDYADKEFKVSQEIDNKGTLWTGTVTEFLNEWEDRMADSGIGGNNLLKLTLDDGKGTPITTDDIVTIGDNIIDAIVYASKNIKNNYALGYKLKLTMISPHEPNLRLNRTIFVNEKGYYQVPSNMAVTEITLYDGATATVDYIAEYNVTYDDVTEPNTYEAVESIVGQVSGEWDWGTSIGSFIESKYWAYDVEEDTKAVTQQVVENWNSFSYEGTPYTILNIQSTSNTQSQRFIVGRTGTLTLEDDYPTQDIFINGKRMIEAPSSRQDYLDEWEYVIDPSVYGSSADQETAGYWWIVYNYGDGNDIEDWNQSNIAVWLYIDEAYTDKTTAYQVVKDWYELDDPSRYYDQAKIVNPKPNTVYGIINTQGDIEYRIYYLDKGWFNVEFPNIENGDFSIAYAHVPVYGMFNYNATIMKKFWNAHA